MIHNPGVLVAHKDPHVIACAREVINGFKDVSRSLCYVTLLTDDGFEIASLTGDEKKNRRVASMVSSMQALGDAVARDLVIGRCQYIIIAAEAGYVIQMRVPEHSMVLAAHFDAAETVGKALSVSRAAVSKVRDLLLEHTA